MANTGVDFLSARFTLPSEKLRPAIYARDDRVVPLSEGEHLARSIPGARFAVLEGRNHILQEDEPAWREFCHLVREFVGLSDVGEQDNLTDREKEILRHICMAKSNKQIAIDLDLNEKTVRNHASNIFAKGGVQSRQEVILRFSRQFADMVQ